MQKIEGMENSIYDKRILAHIVMEAETPMIIGSGAKNSITDAEILKDVNGLPYIPGTSIAGVLRHGLDEELAYKFFGFNVKEKTQDDDKSNDSKDKDEPHGSEIIFSEAKLLNDDGTAIDGISDCSGSSFLKRFERLPKRNHVRLTNRGVAADKGKFDEEVIYKGSRFAFEIEMMAKSYDDDSAEKLLNEVLGQLYSATFRIGGGTRKGFGKVSPVEIRKKAFDLKKPDEFEAYLQFSSKLSDSRNDWETFKPSPLPTQYNTIQYELRLTPQDFFYFGSGLGDEDVDDTPVYEDIILWNTGKGVFKKVLLIPATSLKGALSHRVAFNYNLKREKFADSLEDPELEKHCGVNNDAVRMLFGFQDVDKQRRGHVIFNDILSDVTKNEKILNHVKIDRFTGGAMDGALFSEKVIDGKGLSFSTTITVIIQNEQKKEKEFNDCITALEAAMKDIDNGTLPLGGGSGRGHGIFKCEITKNGKRL